MKNTQRR